MEQQEDTPETRLDVVSQTLEDEKAEEVTHYDLRGKTHIADYMIIANGRSTTHVKALANKLLENCKSAKIKPVRAEGIGQGDWILVDAGDVFIHLFRAEVRDFYDMDRLYEECEVKSFESSETL